MNDTKWEYARDKETQGHPCGVCERAGSYVPGLGYLCADCMESMVEFAAQFNAVQDLS